MKAVHQGDWVQIRSLVLPAGQRASQVPEDTQQCDLVLWVKGFAQAEADLGEEVPIITVTGRKISGVLHAIKPSYVHGFGDFQPELAVVSSQVKHLLWGE